MHQCNRYRGINLASHTQGQLVVSRAAMDGAPEQKLMTAQLPEGQCIDVAWEPGMEQQLAVALRGAGAVLWAGGNDLQMWSGMRYKNSLNKFTSSHREFDPLV